MTPGSPDLIAGYWTLAGRVVPFGPSEISPHPFRARVEAAARAGYRGVGLIHADLAKTAANIGLPEMKAILASNGMRYVELEFLVDWFSDGERRAASDSVRRDLLKAAGLLGARDVKIGPHLSILPLQPAAPTPSLDQMIESFRLLCVQAANVGTTIALEIMPFGNVRTVAQALAIVQGADHPAGGLLLDMWHVARGGIRFSDLERIPPGRIAAAELSDADAEPVGDLWQDTIHRRRLCGDGCLDLYGFISSVRRVGYEGPWSVEVISEELRACGLEEAAMRSYRTTAEQFAGTLDSPVPSMTQADVT